MALDGIPAEAVIESGGFALHQRGPTLALHGLVRRLTAYRTTGPLPGLQREVASLTVPLIFVFDAGFELAFRQAPGPGDRLGSFVAGLAAGPVLIRTPAAVSCLQVDFTPLGAARFFGPALGDLAERMVGLGDFGDREFSETFARLAEANDWNVRMRLAEAFVVARMARRAPPPAGVVQAFRLIRGSGGRARVEQVAGRVDWSRRHLAGRFREAFGITPKTLARVARFDRARHLALAAERPDWAGIAAGCGYSDQSHLVNDFQDLAGLSPASWRAA